VTFKISVTVQSKDPGGGGDLEKILGF